MDALQRSISERADGANRLLTDVLRAHGATSFHPCPTCSAQIMISALRCDHCGVRLNFERFGRSS